jgi:DHA1 family tetracycline resistance protein-like MFS transporter
MTDPTPARGRPAAAFILITVALDVIALGIVIPVLPGLVTGLNAGGLAAGARLFGIFGVAWSAMQFLFSPLLGALSDRFGRRAVLLTSLTGLGLDYILMALAPTIWWLLVGRILSGITAATFATAGAYVADVTPPEGRARMFGLVNAAFGIGFMVGPALGGVLGDLSPRLPFWVAAVLTLANALYGLAILPESLPPERRGPVSWSRANPIGALGLLHSRPGLLGLASVQLLYYLAHWVLPSTFVLYAQYRYQWNHAQVGLTLMFVGLCTALVQGLLVGRVVQAVGARSAVLVGLLCGALGMAWYGLAPTGALFLLAVPFGALMGLYNPAALSLMSERMASGEQGRLQGANSSLMGVVGLFAPFLYPFVFAAAVARPGPGAVAISGAPFLLAALCLLLGAGIAVKAARHVASPR